MHTLVWMAVAAVAALDPRVDAVFQEYDRPDSRGCALGVYQEGAVAYRRGFGVANLEHGVPITPDTVFYVGSVSKQFTAMSVALAAREGKLSLDDPVRKFLPEVPDFGKPIRKRWRFGDETLAPSSKDEFRSSLGTIRFQRGESGAVTGFTISTGRTRNLRWEKR